jgi:hypothetical protein
MNYPPAKLAARGSELKQFKICPQQKLSLSERDQRATPVPRAKPSGSRRQQAERQGQTRAILRRLELLRVGRGGVVIVL